MKLQILEQPDDTTCGPTSLHAVYNYLGYEISLQELIQDVHSLEDGGTLAVLLGADALKRGFRAEIYSYNLKVFDPAWKTDSSDMLVDHLYRQLQYKTGKKFRIASLAYIDFLKAGGKILFDNLTAALLKKYFDKNLPVLAGLSATYLYDCKREHVLSSKKIVYDDIRGEPSGHFVVLRGFNESGMVKVADPYRGNPVSNESYYEMDSERLLNAIMLGIITYDANLLIVDK
ncbi:MAG: C39 family peptidase [Spirochaetia bacterium]|nr:C39 family peptidase [Spirochaetia bacterium]